MQDTLISGASIAGPALAHWLCRHDDRPSQQEIDAAKNAIVLDDETDATRAVS